MHRALPLLSLQNDVPIESLRLALQSKLPSFCKPQPLSPLYCIPCHRNQTETHFTHGVKAHGLNDLLITTEDKLIPFSQARPIRQTFFLVRPWNCDLLELPDHDDTLSMVNLSLIESPLPESPRGPGDSESHSHWQALRLIPFGAILLAQQRSGEYKRVASDHDIVAQVKDMTSLPNIMDVRTLEIL